MGERRRCSVPNFLSRIMHISKGKKEDKTTFKIRIKTKAVSKPQVIGAFSPNFLPKKNFFSLVLRSNLRSTLTTLSQFEIVRGLCLPRRSFGLKGQRKFGPPGPKVMCYIFTIFQCFLFLSPGKIIAWPHHQPSDVVKTSLM